MVRTKIISREEHKRNLIEKALGENGDNFIALADQILDENRQHAVWQKPPFFSQEEINGLADIYAAQSGAFDREQWISYIGNKKKVWVVNFGLGGLPLQNESGTVIQIADDDSAATTFLVEAETANHANDQVTEWLDHWRLTNTTLASARVIAEFEERKAVAKK